jgi:hypothetical protein
MGSFLLTGACGASGAGGSGSFFPGVGSRGVRVFFTAAAGLTGGSATTDAAGLTDWAGAAGASCVSVSWWVLFFFLPFAGQVLPG